MRNKALYVALAFFVSRNSIAQSSGFNSKAQKLLGAFKVYHYKPIDLNPVTSAEIADLFIKELDMSGFTLKQSDVNALQKDKNNVFEQINSGSTNYLDNAKLIYKKALVTMDSLLTVLSSKKINFTENDTSYSIPASANVFYSPSVKQHLKRLEKNVKRRSYERVVNLDGFEKLSETEFNAKATEFSKNIIANFQAKIKDWMSGADKTVESALLNAIALRHDPHSNYFTQEQKKEWNKQLSSKVESFGFDLSDDDDGNILVSYIEPGGSAWISNEVNEGDIFISAKLGGSVLSNDGLTGGDIMDKLDRSSEKRVELILKKQNGQQKAVRLIKQKAASTTNSVKGYILKGREGKIGYISLPSFYNNDREGDSAPSCANDVAKEILKLEGDTISGLILDLRNNGGGSMLEAINLAGIFVDEGPLFIYKEKNKKPTLIKDVNRGAIFKKPLVVMINEISASASELFSNIVKDYNLGLVVGQTSYGKGTAQSILPLDTNLWKDKKGGENVTDFIKITQAKFYRLNNSTHQGTGVVPDITIAASPGYAIYKESKESFFLESDIVTKNVVYTPKPALNIELLKQKSADRIAKSSGFKRYKLCADSISDFLNTSQKTVLKFNEFKKENKNTETLFQSFENASQSSTVEITCLNNTFDKKLTEVNEHSKEFNDKVINSIEEDIFINEAFHIINDIIQTNK